MQITPSSTFIEATSAVAVAGGSLSALAVSVHLSDLAPYILAASIVAVVYLWWRKRATHINMVLRLFFFCFTFLLGVMVVFPWAAIQLGTA